ncbi:flavodoxin family protein [Methanocella conradii]|uniref:flavodoxin family protein n=1 Tax=Methanocella conradii TaxID=1175444 RepID=UPI0024B328FC|nr:flavodoxin family protein [Methanocella conradii]MDI6896215.1 flavodoxin family protein [Methanocella conradii]
MYKVVGIVGSPRPISNTRYLVSEALETLKKEGIDVELITLGDKRIAPCEACNACAELFNCRIEDDFQEIYEKMVAADGIIVGSPVYFGSAAPQVMALLDRAGYIGIKTRAFERKVGAAIAVARRAGANFTFAQLNYFFFINGMIVPGSTYWNVGYGLNPESVRDDEEAIRTVQNLAKNMAWLIKKLKA